MALVTYSDLQTSIGSWLGRSDLTATIPDFIVLFEAEANRRLRVRQMETTTTMTLTLGVGTLPTDYLEWKSVTSVQSSSSINLEYADHEWLVSAYPTYATGSPRFFSIQNATLTVFPQDSSSLTFDYVQKIPALSAGNQATQWLWNAHPDLYLFGSLVEANLFMLNPEHGLVWKQRRDELFDEIQMLSNKSGGPSAIRATGPII